MCRFKAILWLMLPAIVFLAGWQIFVHGNQRLEFLFASPYLVAQTAVAEIASGSIWHHVYTTFSEAALGLLAGTVLGTIVGLLLWGNGRIDFITKPYVIFIGCIPIFALAPMTIIWFGIGLLSKVVMAGFAVFFVSLLQAYEGAHNVANQHLGFSKSIAAPTSRVVQKIVIPGAIGWVISGYKMSIGSALVGAFIGEFVSSEAGLGYYILKASALYDTPRVLFGVLLISLLGMAMTSFAWALRRIGRSSKA